jgi:hypothetical protein
MDEERFYQAYFRTRRGGVGIDYRTARHELLTCLGPSAHLTNEWPGRHRLALSWLGDESSLVAMVTRLGYTQAVLRAISTPWSGREPDCRMAVRWPVGRIVYRGRDLQLTEVWVADEEDRLDRSPHRAGFAFASAPEDDVSGPRLHRRLSPLDAKLVANLAGLSDGSRVLDPFAGLGAIGRAAMERDLDVWVSDIDPDLTPGLRERFPARFALADAGRLPFSDGWFDGILGEPPYHRRDRAAVVASLPELARVVRPGGVAVLLIADWMRRDMQPGDAWTEELRLPVHRHGIECSTLIWRRR